jgi:ricin-type beta-trefoil lectin protein
MKFRRLTRATLLSSLLVASVGVVFAEGAAADPAGYRHLMAQHSAKCLDVSNASTANGARIQQWTCVNAAQQQWTFANAVTANGHTWYKVRAAHSGKCLDVRDGSTANGATVWQWSCVDVQQQQWRLAGISGTPWFYLVSRKSGKCLDVSDGGTSNGTIVKQWTCTNVPQQHWATATVS